MKKKPKTVFNYAEEYDKNGKTVILKDGRVTGISREKEAWEHGKKD